MFVNLKKKTIYLRRTKIAGVLWLISLIIFGLLLLSLYNNEENPSDLITFIFLLDIFVGMVAFCCLSIFGFLHIITKSSENNTVPDKVKIIKAKLISNKFMSNLIKTGKNSHMKFFIIGIFILLLLITYQLYKRDASAPKTEFDCLKLGSDKRAEACLKLLESTQKQEEFPIDYLTVDNIDSKYIGNCLQVTGTVTNSYNQPADYIQLRVDFIKTKDDGSFHYEVLSPFGELEQVQPSSKKVFTTCLRSQSVDAVENVQNWSFTIIPFSAKIYKK